jgi:general secretion pathway protein D
MRYAYLRIAALIVIASLASACAAGRAFGRGESAARAGDWETAVDHYRRAVEKDPSNPEYRIAYERAMISASQVHLEAARIAEARGQTEDALREYRRASELDPANRQLAAKVTELERTLRDQIEASRPRNSVQQLREQARQEGPPALFNLNTVMAPLVFNQASLRDIFGAIAKSTGINIIFDSTFQDRVYTTSLNGVTLEQALNSIVTANQLFYKIQDPKTVLIIPDNAQKRAQYEEQLVQNFYISHVDPLELAQMLNQVIRPIGGQQLAPVISANKTASVINVRATTAMMAIIERMIESNDKPRAEIIVDVQILEVNRSRAKQYGIDLGNYAINAVFSPERDPRGTASAADGGGATLNAQPFNANTISRGVSTNDFYLSVPSAVVRFLEQDSETKVIAKPQLRGAEGVPLELALGEDIPVPSTTFTPVAAGGANSQPLTSFNYRPVGVNVRMTAKVTYEGDIRMELFVESSTLGTGIVIAGQELPSFGSRKVTTVLRLREGESSLLAGLLREDQRKLLSGFPWLLRVPVIKQLFSNNDTSVSQSDIVMLLTPRIVRTHELTPQDVGPIRIGTQANLGLSGPPPLLAPPGATAAAPAPVAPADAQGPPAQPALAQPGAPVQQLPPQAPPPTANAAATPGAAVPTGPAGLTGAGGQILVSVPQEFRVGAGPYTVPISITGASQISSVSLTVTYNPAVLRVRVAQEGPFLRSGGVQATFTQQGDPSTGRLDIAIVRPGDTTGVAGTGLLAALLFETVGPGPANLAINGSASAPGGAPVMLQFAPVPMITVR